MTGGWPHGRLLLITVVALFALGPVEAGDRRELDRATRVAQTTLRRGPGLPGTTLRDELAASGLLAFGEIEGRGKRNAVLLRVRGVAESVWPHVCTVLRGLGWQRQPGLLGAINDPRGVRAALFTRKGARLSVTLVAARNELHSSVLFQQIQRVDEGG